MDALARLVKESEGEKLIGKSHRFGESDIKFLQAEAKRLKTSESAVLRALIKLIQLQSVK